MISIGSLPFGNANDRPCNIYALQKIISENTSGKERIILLLVTYGCFNTMPAINGHIIG